MRWPSVRWRTRRLSARHLGHCEVSHEPWWRHLLFVVILWLLHSMWIEVASSIVSTGLVFSKLNKGHHNDAKPFKQYKDHCQTYDGTSCPDLFLPTDELHSILEDNKHRRNREGGAGDIGQNRHSLENKFWSLLA